MVFGGSFRPGHFTPLIDVRSALAFNFDPSWLVTQPLSRLLASDELIGPSLVVGDWHMARF